MDAVGFSAKSVLEEYDSTPTTNSKNSISSGAVKAYVDDQVSGATTSITQYVDGQISDTKDYVDDKIDDVAQEVIDEIRDDLPEILPEVLTPSVITNELYSGYGATADLTVDELRTDWERAQKYLASDTSKIDFIHVHDEVMEFITATTDGSQSEQLVVDGRSYYWTDNTHTQMTSLETTSYPVMVYVYDEVVKASIKFANTTHESTPTITPQIILGAGSSGSDPNRGKAFIVRDSEAFNMYLKNMNGEDLGMFISNQYTDLIGLRKPTDIDFSDWDSGMFSETLDGNIQSSFQVDFDAQNRPIKFTDSVGHETEISWAGGGSAKGSSVRFTSSSPFTLKAGTQSSSFKTWDGTIEYSQDGDVWYIWDGYSISSSASGELYLKGTGNTCLTRADPSYTSYLPWIFSGSSDISCRGNIENLLDYSTVSMGQHPTMADSCFRDMFKGCTSLVTAPRLPAVILTNSCYRGMFYGCTSLTSTPQLPATSLAPYCYSEMFHGCMSLTTAPVLPATIVDVQCYSSMFSYSSIRTLPNLPATALVTLCYGSMFFGCESIIVSTMRHNDSAIEFRIPTAGQGTDSGTGHNTGREAMFAHIYDITSSDQTPDLNTPYYYYAPDPSDLPYLTFSSSNGVKFYLSTGGGTSGWSDFDHFGRMFYSTDLVTWREWNGYSIIDSSSAGNLYLRGTQITHLTNNAGDNVYSDFAFQFTFDSGVSDTINCTGNIEALLDYKQVYFGQHPYLAGSGFNSLFAGCTNLVTPPQLPTVSLQADCYREMFQGCTSLTTLPELSATTLAGNCYWQMFNGCTSLKLSTTQTGEYQYAYRIPTTGTGTDATNALKNMFSNTGGTFTGTPTINTTYYTTNQPIS